MGSSYDKFRVCYADVKNKMGGALVRTQEMAARAAPEELFFTPMMAKLLLDQQVLRPEFQFMVSGMYSSAPIAAVREVRVLHGKDFIGSVRVAVEVVDRLRFSSNSITQSAQRKDYKETKQYRQALEIFAKHFTPVLPLNRYESTRAHMLMELQKVRGQAEGKLSEFAVFAKHYLAPMITNSPETFDALFKAHGIPAQILEKMWGTLQEIRMFSGVNDTYTFVHQHEGNYLLCRNGSLVTQYACYQVPRTLAEKVGKLKLVDDGVFIRGAGLKHKDNHFILLGEYLDV